MKTVAKFIFKVHRKLYGYPMRSQVRFVLQNLHGRKYDLIYSVALLYICGETIEEVGEWFGLPESEIVARLNEFVEEYKWNN